MKRDSTAYAAPRPDYDKLDCSVRALMAASGQQYEHASAIFSAAGRSLKKGTSLEVSRKVYCGWLCMREMPEVRGWNLASFIAGHPKGRYILHKRGHAFAAIDGVLHDWEKGTGPRTEVVSAWEWTEASAVKMEKVKKIF